MAMKPFCCGDTKDVDILRELQAGELSSWEINPYYFPDPVAPIASRAKKQTNISVSMVAERIYAIAQRCELLLVEGCGGLKVPICKGLLLIDVIAELKCPVILVGKNKLGVLNHVLLSAESLERRRIRKLTIALMEEEKLDASARTNAKILGNLLPSCRVFSLGFMGENIMDAGVLKEKSSMVQEIVAHARLHAYVPAAPEGRRSKKKKKPFDSGKEINKLTAL